MTDTTLIRDAVDLARDRAAAADHPAADAPSPEEALNATLARLGDLGAVHVGDIGTHVQLVRAVAAECLCTAFSLWAQRMVIEYLDAASGDDLARLRDDLVHGRRAGSIAMSTAMQELAGVGRVPITAEPDGDGYVVSGRLAWASNIVPGTVVVFPARLASGGHVILTTLVGDEGLATTPVRGLLALNATCSSMLRFDRVHVPATRVVATSLDAAAAQRTAHYLTQAAFCIGLAERCLAEASAQLQGPGVVLVDEHRDLTARVGELAVQAQDLARRRWDAAPAPVTRFRLAAASAAQQAAQLESTLAGGRGFVTSSPANRRLREAAFLPVQSPSEVQLRWELAQLQEQNEADASRRL